MDMVTLRVCPTETRQRFSPTFKNLPKKKRKTKRINSVRVNELMFCAKDWPFFGMKLLIPEMPVSNKLTSWIQKVADMMM
jgi:hypothetical protein